MNTMAVFSVKFIRVRHVHLNLPEDARSVKSSTDDGINDTTGRLHQDSSWFPFVLAIFKHSRGPSIPSFHPTMNRRTPGLTEHAVASLPVGLLGFIRCDKGYLNMHQITRLLATGGA